MQERRTFLTQLLAGFFQAAVLCLLAAGALWLIGRWRPRYYTSAKPVGGDGFSLAMAQLCAHPDAVSRDWRWIVIHHSATAEGGAGAFERYHKRVKHWDALGYHFVIGNGTQTSDGEIEVGSRWRLQKPGSHAVGYNRSGIGICLVGNFSRHYPTPAQMNSLESLLTYLMRKYHIRAARLIGHRECRGASTECPGSRFSMDQLRETMGGILREKADSERRGNGGPPVAEQGGLR